MYASQVSDPALIAQPVFAVASSNFTDFRLLRGETLQTILFENVKTVEFLADEAVVVRTVGGVDVKMKLKARQEEVLQGFTGTSKQGGLRTAQVRQGRFFWSRTKIVRAESDQRTSKGTLSTVFVNCFCTSSNTSTSNALPMLLPVRSSMVFCTLS